MDNFARDHKSDIVCARYRSIISSSDMSLEHGVVRLLSRRRARASDCQYSLWHLPAAPAPPTHLELQYPRMLTNLEAVREGHHDLQTQKSLSLNLKLNLDALRQSPGEHVDMC
jgi:hypothetical protein